jgi:hypothetical protein
LKLVIPHDFSFAKYFPGDKTLPYFATARKLRDEIAKRDKTIDVIAAEHACQLRTELVQAEGCICYSMTQDLLDEAPSTTVAFSGGF